MFLACCGAALWLCAALVEAPAQAQGREAFEYDPYRVRIWVALEHSPQLPAALGEDIARQLTRESDQVFGAVWRVQGTACPPALQRRAAVHLSALTLDDVRAQDLQVLDGDKLLIVSLRARSAGGFHVAARELDCRSRTFGEVVGRDIAQAENLTGGALATVIEAFAPVVRIERVSGSEVVTRLRAGGLLNGDDSPAAVRPGDLLQPVIRKNDRQGEPRAGGIQRLPFTFLHVESRAAHLVDCRIHTGVRDAIAGRGGRTERLALRIRPHPRGTRLVLRSPGDSSAPLVDYEVLTRSPAEKSVLTPLALTDNDGAVMLPLEEEPLRYIYVRHGQTMLARLPIVPGLVSEQRIVLSNDDLRLLAESFFIAMQNNVMDLVTRRQVLAARIRYRLEHNDVAGAQQLLLEMRTLTSRKDLLLQVEQQQANYASPDKRQQAKVDMMFLELRKMLGKHLDPGLVDEVAAEVRAAERA